MYVPYCIYEHLLPGELALSPLRQLLSRRRCQRWRGCNWLGSTQWPLIPRMVLRAQKRARETAAETNDAAAIFCWLIQEIGVATMIDCFLLPLWKSPRKPREKGDQKNEKEMGKENACYGKMSHETKTLIARPSAHSNGCLESGPRVVCGI